MLVLALVALGAGAAVASLRDDAPPDARGAEVLHLRFRSKDVGRTERVAVVVPPGARARHAPLLVFLHGRGGNDTAQLDSAFFDGLSALGDRAPIVAMPDGGRSSYWHDRDTGNWGQYVWSEVIPRAARASGADRTKMAIGGISMGGFGAFDIARDHPGRFCAVGGHSPALWQSGGETAAGAFDDAEDFSRHDVIAETRADPKPLMGIPLWLDAGTSDPFKPGDSAFSAVLRSAGADLTEHHWSGGHTHEYWSAHMAAYLRFYAQALARC